MAVAEVHEGQDTRDWVKVAVKPQTYARLKAWIEAVYPDARLRPPQREAAELLMALALDHAEDAVQPKATPLDELAALRQGRRS